MKNKITRIAGLIVFLTAAFSYTWAQTNEPTVKILPSNNRGLIKVLYVVDTESSVDIKFYNDEGFIDSDRVKAGSFYKGFIKRYDVSQINSKNYWIEISNADLSVTYSIVRSLDKRSFACVREKTTYRQPVVYSLK